MPGTLVSPLDSPLRRSPDALATQVDGDVMMLVLSTGMYHSLSGVAARIWELLETPATLDGISARIADEYAIPLERSRTDTQMFLEDLLRAGLLETA
ncbi:PqqD family protein [Thermomonas sp.]|uniref:PqqD family protein n=1 Tax=Thermomonas sp. TaxID=1971895 RepID=UPI0035B064B8